jgi:mannose-6-phosphate isomerase-like protein (cupin superfamily)
MRKARLGAALALAGATLLVRVGFVAGAGAGAPNDHTDPPAMLDALVAGERISEPLASLADRIQLAPGEAFRVDEIARDDHTSHHLVAIRNAEVPHRHDAHDLWVVLLRGHGTMLIGTDVQSVGEGSILYVPRGTLHAFNNASSTPAVAYAIYTPPFDGKDRIVSE